MSIVCTHHEIILKSKLIRFLNTLLFSFVFKGNHIGSALLIQNFFRQEKRRLINPFVRMRRRQRGALMFQSCWRGHQAQLLYV